MYVLRSMWELNLTLCQTARKGSERFSKAVQHVSFVVALSSASRFWVRVTYVGTYNSC